MHASSLAYGFLISTFLISSGRPSVWNVQTETQIFPPTTGGGEQLAKDMDVPFLGKLPLDPRIGEENKMFSFPVAVSSVYR